MHQLLRPQVLSHRATFYPYPRPHFTAVKDIPQVLLDTACLFQVGRVKTTPYFSHSGQAKPWSPGTTDPGVDYAILKPLTATHLAS